MRGREEKENMQQWPYVISKPKIFVIWPFKENFSGHIIEGNKGGILCNLETGKVLLYSIQKAQIIKENINKL